MAVQYKLDPHHDNRLREYRMKAGLSMSQIARYLQVSQSEISRVELSICSPFSKRGVIKPWIETLCDYLDVTFEQVFPREICQLQPSNLDGEEILFTDLGTQEPDPREIDAALYAREFKQQLWENLAKPRSDHDLRNRAIVIQHLYGDTPTQLGKEFNLTDSRCASIIQEGLRRLRHPDRSQFLLDAQEYYTGMPWTYAPNYNPYYMPEHLFLKKEKERMMIHRTEIRCLKAPARFSPTAKEQFHQLIRQALKIEGFEYTLREKETGIRPDFHAPVARITLLNDGQYTEVYSYLLTPESLGLHHCDLVTADLNKARVALEATVYYAVAIKLDLDLCTEEQLVLQCELTDKIHYGEPAKHYAQSRFSEWSTRD